jgi:hypothetical protein
MVHGNGHDHISTPPDFAPHEPDTALAASCIDRTLFTSDSTRLPDRDSQRLVAVVAAEHVASAAGAAEAAFGADEVQLAAEVVAHAVHLLPALAGMVLVSD